jgi:tetratricopeptide (TPR) repeat protein
VKRLALAALLALAWTSQARAADPRADEARQACLTGRTQRGIDLLALLYAQTRDANYLYNQGRCFQQNGRPEEAISRFQEYLRKADDLSADEQADVRRQIADCEKTMADQEQRRRASPPATTDATSASAPATPTDEGRGLRVGGALLAAAGVAALGAGLALNLRSRSIEKQIENRFETSGDFSRKTYDQGHQAWTFAWIGYATGAAALGAGALCYYLGSRSPASTELAALPTFGPGMAGGVVRVGF